MRAHRARSRRPEGSTYILTLLVLLVLTVVGLTLSLITQSEMQIGANERLAQRVFYAANSAIDIGTSKALVIPDLRPMRLDLVEPSDTPGLNIRNRVDVSAFVPLQVVTCNLCDISEEAAFKRVNHGVQATATRIGWMGPPTPIPDPPTPLAQEQLSVQVAFQPWMAGGTTAIEGIKHAGRGGFYTP